MAETQKVLDISQLPSAVQTIQRREFSRSYAAPIAFGLLRNRRDLYTDLVRDFLRNAKHLVLKSTPSCRYSVSPARCSMGPSTTTPSFRLLMFLAILAGSLLAALGWLTLGCAIASVSETGSGMHDLTPDEVAAALGTPPTPLLTALWDGDRVAALALIAGGADPRVADTRPVIGHGATPLHFAADLDDAELVRALIAAGAD